MKTINNRFVFDESKPANAGGMSQIFKAFDLQDSREVAIKLFQENPSVDAISTEVFSREQRSLFELNYHPNIIKLIDAGEDEDGRKFLVLEWIDYNLAQYTEKFPLRSWMDFQAQYGLAILNALKYAYSRDVLHRDLTPKNILVTADGTVKVADFGISKFKKHYASALTLAEYKTNPYAPPEDSLDYPDVRDVYSFVVTALECIRGEPFSDVGQVKFFLENDLVCSDFERAVLEKAIDNDPEARPFNIIELAEQLIEGERKSKQKLNTNITVPISITTSVVNKYGEFSLQDDGTSIKRRIIEELNRGSLFLKHERRVDDFDDLYNLVSAEFSFLVKHDKAGGTSGPALVLIGCRKVPPIYSERIYDRAVVVGFRFILATPSMSRDTLDGIEELLVQLTDELALKEAKVTARARDRILEKWQDALDVKREIERQKEDPILYKGREIEGNRIVFSIEQDVELDERNLLEQPRVVKDSDSIVASGEVEWVEDSRLTLFCENEFDYDSIPENGRLLFDTHKSRVALDRQKDALEILRSRRSAKANLYDLLLDPAIQAEPVPSEVSFFQTDLDESKRNAVRAAIGSENLLVVEGPPGTGKTKFIVEAALQHLKRGASVLLTSQTHIALDNALEKLQDLMSKVGGEIEMVRIGRKDDPRVAASSKNLLLENGIGKWIEKVKSDSDGGLMAWAEENGILYEKILVGMAFARLRSVLDSESALTAEVEKLTKMKDAINTKINAQTRESSPGRLEETRDQLAETTRALSEATARLRSVDREKDEAYAALETIEEIGKEIYRLDLSDIREFENDYLGSDDKSYRCREVIGIVEDWQLRLGRRKEFQAAYLMNAQLVAGTCVGIAGTHMKQKDFDVCIVDEASKALPTEILVPLVKARKWLVVGDTKQLPPFFGDFIGNKSLCDRFGLEKRDYRTTLLDYLVERLPEHSKMALTQQYRMAKPIGELVSNCFYGGMLKSEKPFSGEHFIKAKAVPASVSWFSTSRNEQASYSKARRTFVNTEEIEEIRKLLLRLEFAASMVNAKYDVVVMSGYAAQVTAMIRTVASLQGQLQHLTVECCTVDTYQGREADIAIYSVTRSNDEGDVGFLKESERINVALSRGKELLCIVGDLDFCERLGPSNPLSRVIAYIRRGNGCAIKEVE